jgi:hypothetical protein
MIGAFLLAPIFRDTGTLFKTVMMALERGDALQMMTQSEVQNEALARKVIVMNVVVDFLKKIVTTGPANLTDDVRIAIRRMRDVLHPWIKGYLTAPYQAKYYLLKHLLHHGPWLVAQILQDPRLIRIQAVNVAATLYINHLDRAIIRNLCNKIVDLKGPGAYDLA